MPRSINRVVLSCGLLVFAAAAGCQRGPTWDLGQVEGTVTKDGRPLPQIEVAFVADLDAGTQGPKASAVTDESGHYRLRNDNGGDGAVVGKHRVLLGDAMAAMAAMARRIRPPRGTQPKPTTLMPPKGAKRPQELKIPPRYGRFDQTPLRVEVHPGPQTLDFEIR